MDTVITFVAPTEEDCDDVEVRLFADEGVSPERREGFRRVIMAARQMGVGLAAIEKYRAGGGGAC